MASSSPSAAKGTANRAYELPTSPAHDHRRDHNPDHPGDHVSHVITCCRERLVSAANRA
nr:hypothetical protein [Kibdelosporangium sp. MJ126-NF4]CTQ93607.1 hypothetical protein [Kibdelosporangium sp. MJ126-NF4]